MRSAAGSRRRITLVGPVHPFRGGIAQFGDALLAGLRERGHDVDVVTFSRQYPALLFPGTSQYEPESGSAGPLAPSVGRAQSAAPNAGGAVSAASGPGNAGRPAPGDGGLGGAARLIDSLNPLTWFRAARHIARRRPDVVVVQYWHPFFAPAFGTIAGRLRRTRMRIIAVVHNVLPHERHAPDTFLGRFFLRRCDSLLALSESVARDVVALDVGAPVRVVHHPVYEHFGEATSRADARLRLGLAQDAEILLFFGFIRRYKGLHVLLDAMPEIVRRRPKARLLVAGEFYDAEEPYRDRIRTRGLEDYVDVHASYVPAGDVAAYFSACNVVVQPYVTATQSGVVQTAFHFERPVVVTDVGGLAEVVPRDVAGLIVPPHDPEALADAVARFFDEGLEERLSDGARQEKQRHSWDRFFHEIETLM